jgi:hypothetical protein
MTTKPGEHRPKAVLVRMKPSMTRKQMVQNLIKLHWRSKASP